MRTTMKAYAARLTSAFLMALTLNSQAFAHQQGGSLLKAPNATARFDVICTDTADSVYFNVQGNTKSATFLVQATLEKNGVTESLADKVNGDRKPSAAKFLVQGGGTYHLTFSKIKKKPTQKDKKLKGRMAFGSEIHCYTAGNHTETVIKRR
jgi:hypothetical protein